MTALRIIMLSYERGFLDPASEASRRLERLANDDIGISAIVISGGEAGARASGNVSVRAFEGNGFMRMMRGCLAGMAEIRAAKKRGERVLVTAQDPFIAGSMAFRLSRIMGVPYEIQEHGDFYSGYWEKERWMNVWLARLGRFVLRRADAVRAVSERVRDHLITRCGVPAERIVVNPVASDLSWHAARTPRPWPDRPVVLVPCRFVEQKGLDTLLAAFKRLVNEGVGLRARIVGSGPLESEIRNEISKSNLRDRVSIEPWGTQESLWSNADLLVCSSRYEGWGRVIVEAMAAGVPVVTTDVGCAGSVLRPQVDGRVVPPNDAAALARAIREQFEESDRRTWMAANARKRFSEVVPSQEAGIAAQREAWKMVFNPQLPTSNFQLPRYRAWMTTTALIAFATIIRATSFILFWKSLGVNRDGTFFTLVQNWFLGNGYSFVSAAGCASAYRSPGYLFFLTGVYGLFGFANFFAQALIQNILAVLLVYLVYRLGWSVSKDRRVGLIAGFVIALHPYTFYHYSQYYHTILSSVFLVGLLLALHALERTKKWQWAVGSGALIAMLAYVQGTILPATAFLSLWLFIRWWPNWKRAVGMIAIMAAVSIALIAPWTYRNWTVFHSFVFLTTDMGHAFAKANNSNAYMMNALGYPQEAYEEHRNLDRMTVVYTPLPEVVADFHAHGAEVVDGFFYNQEHPLEPGLRQTCATRNAFNEVAFDSYWLGKGKQWIAEHYWTEGYRLQIQKAVQFWSPTLQPTKKFGAAWSFGNEGLVATLAKNSLAVYVFMAELLAVLGVALVAWKKRSATLAPILIVLAVYTFMHSFFAGYTKYRIPLDNVLVILAAIALVWIWDAWKGRGMHMLNALRARWKPWMTTTALISMLAAARLSAYALFWKTAANIGDPGFKILVRNWFHGYGYSFVAQAGCPTTFRSPGYLLYLTGVYLAFGLENYRALFLIQVAIVVLVGYLVYRLGRALTGDRRVGWVALALFIAYPYTFYHYAQYYHTFLSSLFIVTLVLALVRLDQTKRLIWAVVAGLAIGCAAYVQGTVLVATPFISLWLLVRWRAVWKKAILTISTMAIVSVALIAPWTYRNWTIFHRFIPLTTDIGFGLYKTNNPYAYGLNALGYPQEVISGESIVNPDNPLEERYFFTPNVEAALREHGWFQTTSYVTDWFPRPPGVRETCTAMSTLSEPDFSAFWIKQTWAWVSANYWPDFVKLQIQKVEQFWSPGLHPSIKSETQWSFGTKSVLARVFVFANTAFVAIVDLLAVLGIVWIVRSKRMGSFVPIVIILATYTVLHSVFPGYTKYRIPIDNLILILGAIGGIALWDRLRHRKKV